MNLLIVLKLKLLNLFYIIFTNQKLLKPINHNDHYHQMNNFYGSMKLIINILFIFLISFSVRYFIFPLYSFSFLGKNKNDFLSNDLLLIENFLFIKLNYPDTFYDCYLF
jgi:hypothetical protein